MAAISFRVYPSSIHTQVHIFYIVYIVPHPTPQTHMQPQPLTPFKAAVAKSISWTAVRRCNLYARIFRWSPHANFGRLMLEYWGFVVVAVKNVNASAEICMQWWKANWDAVKAQQISWKKLWNIAKLSSELLFNDSKLEESWRLIEWFWQLGNVAAATLNRNVASN